MTTLAERRTEFESGLEVIAQSGPHSSAASLEFPCGAKKWFQFENVTHLADSKG